MTSRSRKQINALQTSSHTVSLPNSKGKPTAFFPGQWACRCCSLTSSWEGVGHSTPQKLLRSQGLPHLSPGFVLSVTGPYSVILSDLKLTRQLRLTLDSQQSSCFGFPKLRLQEWATKTWPRVFLRGAKRVSLCQGSHSDILQCRRMEWGQRTQKAQEEDGGFLNPRWGRGGYLRSPTPPKPHEGKGVFREKGGGQIKDSAMQTAVCPKSDLLSTGRSSAKCCCSKLYRNPTKTQVCHRKRSLLRWVTGAIRCWHLKFL